MQGLLIAPRHATRAPGRPTTDRLDGTWRQRLPPYGLRAGALRPAAHVCVLRGSRRPRQRRMTSAAHHGQHMHKAFAQRNLNLTPVVRESPGVTGLALLKAMRAGERDPQHRATLRTPHGPHTEDAIARALQGPWSAAHRCA